MENYATCFWKFSIDAKRRQLGIVLLLNCFPCCRQGDAQVTKGPASSLLTEHKRQEQVLDISVTCPSARSFLQSGYRKPMAGLGRKGEFAHVFLRGIGIEGSTRLACFLCTACRLTPRASAICCQLIPERNADSTWRSSSWSVRTRNE